MGVRIQKDSISHKFVGPGGPKISFLLVLDQSLSEPN